MDAPAENYTFGDGTSITAPVAPEPIARPIAAAHQPLAGNDDELIARAALAEGDHTPDSWRAVAGVVRNRMAKTGKTAAQVLSEPNQFEAYSNGSIQGVDINSPAFKSALGVAQGVKPGDVPYDSFYSPSIVAARGHGTPPFDPTTGVKIGTQLFGTGSPNYAYGQAPPAGLSPDEQKAWDALQPPAPTTVAGQTPGVGTSVRNEEGKLLTKAQEKWYSDHQPPGGWNPDLMPKALAPGHPLPATPGAHYVDYDGVEHVVPGGALGFAKSVAAGVLQGAVMDTTSSANKLTGGGFATDPMAGALSQTQGGPGAIDMAQAALQGSAQQQRDYATAHQGDQAAQGGRFIGQSLPSTAAAALVPEIKIPGMAAKGAVGVLANLGSKVATNAARGVAATAPNVGANAAPVGEQLATGAAAGVLAPAALGAAGKAGAAMAGRGHEATPEVANLAKTAMDKYGIPLRAGQIAGVGDRSAAFHDSNLLAAPGAGTAANNAIQLKALTKAAAKTIGVDSDKLTPEVADQARRQIGSVFEEAAKKTGIRADDQLTTELAQVGSQARELGLDQSQINALDLQIQKITDLASRHGGTGVIPGDVYQSLTESGSSLSRIMKNDHGSFADLASDIRGALDGAVSRASAPEDQAALTNARFQWKNLKTLQPLIAKAGPDGAISPVLLRSRVMAQFPNYAFGDGGDLGELARIGQTFMKEPPNSGTAHRLRDMMLGGAGGLEAGLFLHDPSMAAQAALGAGALAVGRYGTNAVRGILNDNPIARASVLRNADGQASRAAGILAKVGNVTRPTQIPLSALGVNNVLNSFNGTGATVGANSQ